MTFSTNANRVSPLQQRNQRLFEMMIQAETLKPTFTISKLFVFVIALLIHSVTLVFALGALLSVGVALLGLAMGNKAAAAVMIFIAIICAVVAWLLGPRFGKWPINVVSREDFPELYALAESVATSIGAKPIDGIQFMPDYNASFRKVGLRQKSLMSLGVPLWAVLTEQERIALIGHELAHGVNGDFTRSFVVWNAFQTLVMWHRMAASSMRIRSVVTIFTGLLYLLTALLLSTMHRLMFHESRRAEYLADGLGASVGGTDAMLGVLDKLQFGADFRSYLQQMKQVKIDPETLFSRFRNHIDRILTTPEEFSKLTKEHEDATYSLSHPPLAFRKDFLKARHVLTPKFVLSPEALARLRSELDPSIDQLQQILLKANNNPRVDG